MSNFKIVIYELIYNKFKEILDVYETKRKESINTQHIAGWHHQYPEAQLRVDGGALSRFAKAHGLKFRCELHEPLGWIRSYSRKVH